VGFGNSENASAEFHKKSGVSAEAIQQPVLSSEQKQEQTPFEEKNCPFTHPGEIGDEESLI
jgi:hypothetical protein